MTLLVDNIKKYGKLVNMNIKQVSLAAGFSENAIYGWKTHAPSAASIEAVAKVLHVSSDKLTGNTETGKTSKPIKIDLKEAIDNEEIIKTYDGKPIPPEDLALIKRLMRGE